jgi:hypothetical protein
MVFSLEHDIKVTKNHQNLLPTQSVLVAHTVDTMCYHRPSGAVELSNPSSGPVSIGGPMPLSRRSDSAKSRLGSP